MTREAPTLATIGYEGAALDDFVATLASASVSLLIDVRELPISRRRGFAKGALSNALAEVGIDYLHLRGLGDPKPGRDAARSGDHAGFLRVFRAHLMTPEARRDLRVASAHAVAGGACLMCYERDHAACHRQLVAEAIRRDASIPVTHLGVSNGLATSDGAKLGRPAAVRT